MLSLFSFRNVLNKLEEYVAYIVLAAMLFIIVYWLFNDSRFRLTLEGLANEGSKTKSKDASAKPKPKSDDVKCPEDCTSVKELQTKLSDAMKKVQTLEASIIQNTNTGKAHAQSIADMNQAINDMQSNQKDE
jgi:septal ring factor EnvC (AmiA/AmiB activator)